MLRGLRMDLLPPLLLLLGGLWVQPARAGSHSYRYFVSSLSEGVPGVPRFSEVGFVDDVPVAGYSSDTRREEPRGPWVEKAVDPQYWERETERARGVEQVMRANVAIVMERVNQTRVPPGTMVSRRKSGDRTLLTCYAYGFYPREIEVKWIRSGVEMPLEWSQLLPNPDGTYQIKATVEVQEGDEKNMYECQVEHSSLPEIVTVVYKEKSPGPSIGLIAGVVLAVALAVGLAAFGVWYAFFRNKRPVKDGYTPPREGPADSSSSASDA